ncbi:MAG: polysaccharide biosynthesis C-terminal domain-containing protein [Roseibium sp.]|nr:polysaccharide biosynthesis C-terminal domain-containing protein [Roseibium sp.]
MTVKVASISSSFLLFTFAARVMGEEHFGHFAVFFSAASMLAVVAAFGQEMLIIRLWSKYIAENRLDLAKGSIVFGLIVSAIGGVIGASVIALYFGNTDSVSAAVSAGAYVAAAILLLFLSSLARTVVSILAGDGQRELTALFFANLALIACYFLELELSMIWVINLLTIGKLTAVSVQVYCLLRVIRQSYPKLFQTQHQFDAAAWLPSSCRLWIASALETSNQYLDVILIGLLLDPIAAGAYFVATRLANGFASIADAFNMFAMRHFPELYFRRDSVGMARLLTTLAVLTAFAVAGGLAVIVVAGHWILLLFGEEYVAYYHVLLVLCIGTAAMAASGPAAPVLMVTGSESPYLRIVALSVALRITGFVVLIPVFEILGAAVATAFSLIVMAVLIGNKSQAMTGMNVTATRIFFPGSVAATSTKETQT